MNFNFVDNIVFMEPGKSIHAQRLWSHDLLFFKDHFPSFSVVPGVLLTEMMGQAGALCVESKHPEFGKALLMQIKNAVFRSWVLPEQMIDIYADVQNVTKDLCRMKTRAAVSGKMVCSAELIFVWEQWEKIGLTPEHKLLAEYNLAHKIAGDENNE